MSQINVVRMKANVFERIGFGILIYYFTFVTTVF